MKYFIGIVFLFISCSVTNSQDISSEKHITKLKNVKHQASNGKGRYSIILNDGSFLSVTYNVVESGECNARYDFILTPAGFHFKTSAEFNYEYLLNHIDLWTQTINLKSSDIELIKKKIQSERSQFKNGQPFYLELDFIKGYDEFILEFNNTSTVINFKIFVRRLL